MRYQSLERNLTLFKWGSLGELLFAGAIFIAYQLHTIGLSFAQIMIGESIFALTIVLFEIPSGVLSDLFGRKKTLLIAEIFFLAGCITFALAQEFWHVVLSQIAFGIGIATSSGTDSAIVYDTLRAMKREGEHKQILGAITSFALIGIALGQMIGGFVGSYNLRIPILMCIPIPLMKIILLFFVKEPPREKSVHTSQPWIHTKSAMKWLCSQRTILFLVMASMFCALAWKIALHTYNPYMELIDVPVAQWGVLTALFNIVSAYIAKKSSCNRKKIWVTAIIYDDLWFPDRRISPARICPHIPRNDVADVSLGYASVLEDILLR